MFDSLKRSMSGEADITVSDAIIAEAGNGEFEAEDFIMEACLKEEDDDMDDDDDFEDEFFEGLDEGGCKKKIKESTDEIAKLVESVLVDEEDDAANDYLDSIADIENDSEIAELVSKIPVDSKDEVTTGINDPDLEKASAGMSDPTIEELADELGEEI